MTTVFDEPCQELIKDQVASQNAERSLNKNRSREHLEKVIISFRHEI
jgi:hypothetical protein